MSAAGDHVLLSGDLSAVSLLEAAQLLCKDSSAFCIELLEPDGKSAYGSVHFLGNHVRDVRLGGLSGVVAFVSMLRMNEGPFQVRRLAGLPADLPLDVPLESLLMQCAELEDQDLDGSPEHRATLTSQPPTGMGGTGTE